MSRLIPEFIRKGLQGSTESERRVTFIGTWASGKTSVLGCMGLTCELLSDQNPKFTYWVDEKTSGIRQFWSDLRRGRFPPSTPPGTYYESSLTLEFKEGFGSSTKVTLPICEVAGEDIQKLIGTYALDPYRPATANIQSTRALFEYILRSEGYILVAPCPRALMWGDYRKEKEPDDLPPDPDLNIARILDAIYRYKQQSRSKPIKGMAILLTKYDRIKTDAESRGMNLYTSDGVNAFMSTYFPQTTNNLKSFGFEVEYFPVYLQVETDDKGNPLKWDDGTGDKIMVNYERRLPVYPDLVYIRLINWIKTTFAS